MIGRAFFYVFLGTAMLAYPRLGAPLLLGWAVWRIVRRFVRYGRSL